MAEFSTESTLLPGPGPYLAKVVNNLDPDFMGGLEVLLFEGTTGDAELQNNTITVKYLPSFWGTTSLAFEGNDSSKFNDVQKSYGMWMVPPDVGTTVVVFFIGGNRNSGFWIGVVPDRYQNHMVPSIGASKNVALTPEQERKYGTKYLPVAEFSKKNRKLDNPKVDEFNKPVHPFADRLLQQGLLLDDIRGVTSSSARREHPSSVFGISTPGPVDTSNGAPKGRIGFKNNSVEAFVSRLGGHQLVMDDGDPKGLNELFRIRTRTGHQILLHNSSDLIYIANAAGSAWIELTSQGKIDIFAQDSVSIHTEGDFNLRADRDFNIEAIRDVNIKSGGNMRAEVGAQYTVNGDRDAQFSFDGIYNLKAGAMRFQSNDNLDFTVGNTTGFSTGNFSLKGADITLAGTGAFGIKSATLAVDGGSSIQLKGNDVRVTGTSAVHVKGNQEIRLTSPSLGLNGAQAQVANPSVTAIGAVQTPVEPDSLPQYQLPNRISNPNAYSGQGWADGKFYKAEDLISIMKRVPTHEPWDQHENINPKEFTFTNTDLDVDNRGKGIPGKPVSVQYNLAPAIGTPPTPTGNKEDDNIAAFLWMLRCCEGTSGPDGYRTRFGPRGDNLFPVDDPQARTYQFADHPRKAYTYPTRAGSITSTAAGAYQFLSKTWDGCVKALGLKDFTPRSQDLGCIYLLKQARALDDIKAGNFTSAINKTKRIWASLPGDVYGQGGKNMAQAQSYFKQGGGTLVA